MVPSVRGVCTTEVEDDGVVFDPRTVSAERIKEDAEYEGVRITLGGKLGTAKLNLQVDVGCGDSVTPDPEMIDFPTLLPGPAPRLLAYPREAVVAEKLHAMVNLGITNTRMKDFFDLWFLCRTFPFEGVARSCAPGKGREHSVSVYVSREAMDDGGIDACQQVAERKIVEGTVGGIPPKRVTVTTADLGRG